MKRRMDIIKLVSTQLNVQEITDSVSSESCGAISLFVGTTRDNFDGKKVVRLEYEAYEPMAINEIKKICKEIREKWTIEHISISHRLGVVPVKEASIIIAISSPHRKESLEAVYFAIDAMKASVPIWKKEVYDIPGGDNSNTEVNTPASAWKSNPECSWTNKSKNSSSNGVSFN